MLPPFLGGWHNWHKGREPSIFTIFKIGKNEKCPDIFSSFSHASARNVKNTNYNRISPLTLSLLKNKGEKSSSQTSQPRTTSPPTNNPSPPQETKKPRKKEKERHPRSTQPSFLDPTSAPRNFPPPFPPDPAKIPAPRVTTERPPVSRGPRFDAERLLAYQERDDFMGGGRILSIEGPRG